MEYSEVERVILLQTAKSSIEYGLQRQIPLPIILANFPQHLQQEGASFVTLHLNGQLRGCIGSLLARQPLISDVAQNAFNASFRDPRFPPVTLAEFNKLHVDISVLSAPQPIEFSSEADLLQKIRPGVDGLILSDQGRRGTFLPSVWEQLPDPVTFLNHLKNKAGLPTNYWSNTIKVERYTAELIA